MTIVLTTHIILGLIGVMSSYAVLMGLLKREISLSFLYKVAFLAFLSHFSAWILGGWYHIQHYTSEGTEIIEAGSSPWTHSFFMETTGHIFLMIPVLAFTLWIFLILAGDRIGKESSLKNAYIGLAALITVLGVLIALSGVVIFSAR